MCSGDGGQTVADQPYLATLSAMKPTASMLKKKASQISHIPEHSRWSLPLKHVGQGQSRAGGGHVRTGPAVCGGGGRHVCGQPAAVWGPSSDGADGGGAQRAEGVRGEDDGGLQVPTTRRAPQHGRIAVQGRAARQGRWWTGQHRRPGCGDAGRRQRHGGSGSRAVGARGRGRGRWALRRRGQRRGGVAGSLRTELGPHLWSATGAQPRTQQEMAIRCLATKTPNFPPYMWQPCSRDHRVSAPKGYNEVDRCARFAVHSQAEQVPVKPHPALPA